ncbi:MAG: Hsp20/alpha crystallin family protein [Anaerolineae bacterium]|nr:Hsp20/alpha crystallin family protein [Anaerolineae bacterium]
MPDETTPYDKPDTNGGDADEASRQRWVIVRHTTIWHPPTDVYERDERLIVVVEIAGMREGEFAVVLENQRLVISGTRQRVAGPDCAYHQLEIPFGEFRTEVSLPWSVTRDDVVATYRDGFLRVELPHVSAQKIQVIDVTQVDENDSDSSEERAET